MPTAVVNTKLVSIHRAAGPGEWTGDEGVAHRAERRCSEGEEGFMEAPEREFRTPGG